MANEELLENVKSWLNLDNEIKALQKEIKSRRTQKKELTDSLISNSTDNFTTQKSLCQSMISLLRSWLPPKLGIF